MDEHWTDRLSEYLDGELEVEEAGALEAHMATCAACRTVLGELRAVLDAADTIEDREPARDLWPGILDRIEADSDAAVVPFRSPATTPRRFSFSLPQLAAAAAVIMFVTGGTVWLLRGTGEPSTPFAIAEPTPAVGGPEDMAAQFIATTEMGYDAAIRQLTAALEARWADLDPGTVEVVQRNLAMIDAAIAEARAALEADPANAYLYKHLDTTLMKKVELLRRVNRLRTAAT